MQQTRDVTTRVAIISQFFPPERNAPANRLDVIARKFSEEARVEVFTVEPSYPAPESFAECDLKAFDSQLPFPVQRLPSFRAHGRTIGRALRELRLARKLVSRAVASRPHVVVASAPTMFLIPFAVSTAKRYGAFVVVDVRDLTWDYALDSPLLTRCRPIAVLVASWIRRTLLRADVVLATNEGARGALMRSGVPSRKILTLPNGIDRVRFNRLSSLAVKRESSRKGVVIGYCGLVGHNQGVGVLLDVAARLKDARFIIAGGGPEFDAILNEAALRGLTNVELVGQVDWAEVVRTYELCDILFAQLRGQKALNDTALPSKIFEYMSTGRPIVYAGGGVAAEVIRRSGAGITVPAENVDSIVDAIQDLARNQKLRTTLAAAGRAAAAEAIREDFVANVIPEILGRSRQFAARSLTS